MGWLLSTLAVRLELLLARADIRFTLLPLLRGCLSLVLLPLASINVALVLVLIRFPLGGIAKTGTARWASCRSRSWSRRWSGRRE